MIAISGISPNGKSFLVSLTNCSTVTFQPQEMGCIFDKDRARGSQEPQYDPARRILIFASEAHLDACLVMWSLPEQVLADAA
jgi:hypothetical protein